MINEDIKNKSFIMASFIEQDFPNNIKRRSMNFLEKNVNRNIIYLYNYLFAINEYLLIYFLFYFYLNPNYDFKHYDFEKTKYFLFRFLSFFIFTIIKNYQKDNFGQVFNFFSKFRKYPNFFIYLIFEIIIWCALLRAQNNFQITLIFIITKSKYFFRIFTNIMKKYPLKKFQYRFALAYTLFLFLVFISNLNEFFTFVMLIISGLVFFLNESNVSSKFDNDDILFLHYFCFFIFFLFYFCSSFVFFRFNKFNFNLCDIYVGIFLIGLDFLKYYLYERYENIHLLNNKEIYSENIILYVICWSFILDCFLKFQKENLFNYLLGFFGIIILFYYHRMFKNIFIKKDEEINLELNINGLIDEKEV